MPSAINVSGRTTRRPGVYGKANAEALSGRSLTINRVALIGEFPFLAKATATTVASARALRDLEPNSSLLKNIADILYTPDNDPAIDGGPTATVLVSAVPTTAASLTLNDATTDPALVLTASAYGVTGNRTAVTIANNATDATLRDVTITRDGRTETFTGLGSGIVMTVTYTGTDADSISLELAHAATAAGGSIVAVAKASLVEAETFTLRDASDAVAVFEFDGVSGPADGVSGTNVAVDVSADTTDIEVASRMVSAINGSVIDVTADNAGGTSATVTITMDDTGPDGNRSDWAETVVNAGFVLTQPTGGQNVDLTVFQQVNAIALDASLTPTSLAFDGNLRFAPDAAPGGTDEFEVVVTGTNKATGLADSETLTWVGTDGSEKTTAKTWSAVSDVSVNTTVGTPTTASVSMRGLAFDLQVAQYATLGSVASRINTFAVQGYTASITSPSLNAIPLDEADKLASTSILSPADADLRADLYSMLTSLSRSELVVPTRAIDGRLPPVAVSGSSVLAGGTETTATTTDWEEAFAGIRTANVQIGWIASTSSAVHAKGIAHAEYMAGIGRGEMNLYTGAASQETLDQLRVRTAALNSRHLSLVAEDIQIEDYKSQLVWLEPIYFALMCAGMQAGTDVAIPITFKRPRVVDTRHGNWGTDEDAAIETALEYGLLVTSEDQLGKKIERDLTTYLVDDNEVFTAISANESLNTSIRGVREDLESFVGQPNFEGTETRIKGIVKTTLRQQVRDRIIKAFDENSITVEDLGSTLRVGYDLVPVFGILFITVEASARLPAATAA